jgi:hypothetical protein
MDLSKVLLFQESLFWGVRQDITLYFVIKTTGRVSNLFRGKEGSAYFKSQYFKFKGFKDRTCPFISIFRGV